MIVDDKQRPLQRSMTRLSANTTSLAAPCASLFFNARPQADEFVPFRRLSPDLFMYLFIYLSKAYNPANRTGSPQGFSLNQILQMWNTIQNMHILHTHKLRNTVQTKIQHFMLYKASLYKYPSLPLKDVDCCGPKNT